MVVLITSKQHLAVECAWELCTCTPRHVLLLVLLYYYVGDFPNSSLNLSLSCVLI